MRDEPAVFLDAAAFAGNARICRLQKSVEFSLLPAISQGVPLVQAKMSGVTLSGENYL